MSYSSMNTGSGLIHQYLGEAFPKLSQLYERLPEIMEVYDSIHNSITSNFNLQTQAYVYNIVGSEFIYSPFIVGTTSESNLTYSLTADRNAAAWTIDPATGVITKTMDTADVGTTVLTITVVDSSINETRTSTINIVTFKDVSSIQDPIEITLNGNQYIELPEGSVFLDPGITYNVSPESSSTEGAVDTSTPGTYILNYKAAAQGINATATRVVKIVSTAPVSATRAKLTLLGDNPEYVQYGAVWGDSGVTAVDASNVVTTGSVDTAVEGAHVITYTATSSSGDIVSTERVVFVQPKYQSQVVVPKAQLISTAIETAISITLINQGLNDTKFVEIVEPPTHGDITSTTTAGVVYTPTNGYTGTDYFTYKVATEDGSNEAVGTIFLTVGLGAANSQINLLINAFVASKIIEVTSGTNIYSVSKPTVSNMAASGFGVDSVGTPTASDSTVTVTMSETTTNYTLEWSSEFTGVIQLPVTFTDGSQSYITNVVLDVQKVPALDVTNNPLDQILSVPFIEIEGDDTSVNLDDSFDVLPDNTDVEIVEVLSSGNIGTPTKSGPRSIDYSMPNKNFNVTESFLIRVAYLPITGLTQLRNVTMVFTAYVEPAIIAKDLTLIAPFNTTTVVAPTLSSGINITGVTSAAHGTASVNNNQIQYIPDDGYTGGDSFNYILSNGSEGVVSVYVRDYDGQFKINNFFQPCNYQTLINFDPFINDLADNPVFVTSTPASNGTVTKNGTTFTYVPNASFVGSDSFTYTMQNSEKPSLNGTATVWIEVLPDGAAPVTSNVGNTPPVITLSPDLSGNTTPSNITLGQGEIVVESTGTSSDWWNKYLNTHEGFTGDFDIYMPGGLNSPWIILDPDENKAEWASNTAGYAVTPLDGRNNHTNSGWETLAIPSGADSVAECIIGTRRIGSLLQSYMRAPDGTETTRDRTVTQTLYLHFWQQGATHRDTTGLVINGNPVTDISNWTTSVATDWDLSDTKTYYEPGATAVDAVDGNITPSVVITGDTIDINTVGTYNTTYTVTNSNGATATATRVVNVTAATSNAVPIDFTDATNIYVVGTPTQTIMQTNVITLEANGTSANSYAIAHKIPTMDPPVGKFLELTFKRDSSNSTYYDQDHTDGGLEIGFIYATDITQIVNTYLSWGYGRVTNTVMVDVPPAPSTNVNGVLRAVASNAWMNIGDVTIDVNNALLTGWDVNTLWKYRFEFTSANEYLLYIYMDGTLVKKTTVTNPVGFVPDTSVISGMSFQHFSYNNGGSKELLADITISTGTL